MHTYSITFPRDRDAPFSGTGLVEPYAAFEPVSKRLRLLLSEDTSRSKTINAA